MLSGRKCDLKVPPIPFPFSRDFSILHQTVMELFWPPPAWADRIAPARRTARGSEPITLAAYPSLASRCLPLPPVSSVNYTVPSPPPMSEPPTVHTKEEISSRPATHPNDLPLRCDEATSKRRSGRTSARMAHSLRRTCCACSRVRRRLT